MFEYCFCICALKNEKVFSREVFICPLIKSVWGDLEFHAKFRILEYSKYTNFFIAVNIFFADCMFSHVGCCLYQYVAKCLRLCEYMRMKAVRT